MSGTAVRIRTCVHVPAPMHNDSSIWKLNRNSCHLSHSPAATDAPKHFMHVCLHRCASVSVLLVSDAPYSSLHLFHLKAKRSLTADSVKDRQWNASGRCSSQQRAQTRVLC